MSMSRRSADALIGLLVVAAVLVLVIALSVTQGWSQRRFTLYMLTNTAADLTIDTKVLLQGLEVGEVASISPRVDPAMGPLSFLVKLRIREQYRDGAPLILPAGTTAEIVPSNVFGRAQISLLVPPPKPYAAGALPHGDTIQSVRKETTVDLLGRVADSLRVEVSLALADTRALLGRLNRTADLTNTEIERTGPELRQTLNEVQRTLTELRPVLAQADSFMAHTDERLGSMRDSIAATLSDTRTLIEHLDTLSLVATGVARDNREDVRKTVNTLYVVSAKLEHFLDQVSRRPLRMITGVRPIPAESLPVVP